MSEQALHALMVIAVAALVTFATRALPFLVFGRGENGEPPRWITYLGSVLPPAVIALLVVYCLRYIQPLSGSRGIPELLSVAVCVLLHLWKRNNMLSIFGATLLYMVLIQAVFV